MKTELEKINCGKVLENCSLKQYTTYRAGGIADYIVFPESIEQLKNLMSYLKEKNIKHKVVGYGSNLLFSDGGYRGVLIKLDALHTCEFYGTKVVVGAGYPLMKLAIKAAKLGLTGLEFAAGIPGTIGGAIYMNAGAYKSDMGYIVSEIKVLTPELTVKTMYNRELEFHYRTSFLQTHPGYICLEATLILTKGTEAAIRSVMEDRKKRRLMTQPLEYPSAGSVFRNPEGVAAGKLIEDCGLKGMRIGGAEVSRKHANFIINVDHANANDIRKLILTVQDTVWKKKKIKLKCEQEFVD
ncbi:MAG TPA: UDP-N-acetylmuramate dehydrogenase [Candidatus Fimihabitans intestinipullorum]|uniref:UDP-N-acetylenolpyruvoylglucosamine reductase n=1 Tax=Candidatus Fimihabitans intestinipullorum TaxID=2840820 RepID=A0A9D1HV43_9BACT|nr:UDP-N-acetylmuramate dehydrogenase [Candidatus Fimihabitans intestinipullorum]